MTISVEGGGRQLSPVFVEPAPIAPLLPAPHPMVRALGFIGAQNHLGHEHARQALVRDMDYDDFAEWTSWVNGLTTGVPPSRRGFSGENICLVGGATAGGSEGPITYLAPDVVLRDELMLATWSGAQRLAGRLDRVGRLLATAIFLIQPYPDGNKRTARLVDLFARSGYDGSPDAQIIIGRAILNEEPQANIDFSELGATLAGLFTDYVINQHPPSDWGHAVEAGVIEAPLVSRAPGLSEDERDSAIDLLNEPYFNEALILAWARERKIPLNGCLDNGKLSAARVLRIMTTDDYQSLLWFNDYHKEAFIQSVVQGFVDGETQVYGDIMELTNRFWPSET